MKVNLPQLAATLRKAPLPAWLVSGDEPLLVQEACDSIRAAARAQGFSERIVFHTDQPNSWPRVRDELSALSLFAERRRIEIHLHNGAPGDGRSVLEDYLDAPSDDIQLLIISARLDSKEQNKRWHKRLIEVGGVVQIWPIDPPQFSAWLAQRAEARGLRMTREALHILAERVEGNLLAANQELDRLQLLCPGGQLDERLVEESVQDSARFDPGEFVGEVLLGRTAHALRILDVLREEGTHPLPILALLARQIRLAIGLRRWQRGGQPDKGFFDQHFIRMRSQIQQLEQAARRLPDETLHRALALCADTDASIKGVTSESPWRLLASLAGLLGKTPQNILADFHHP